MVREDSASLAERRQLLTRHEIGAAALSLERQHGWVAVTVADIAGEAGVSLRTFYRYFPTKSDAFTPLFEAAIDRLHELYAASDLTVISERMASATQGALSEFPGGIDAARAAHRSLFTTTALTPVWLAVSLKSEPALARTLLSAHPDIATPENAAIFSAVLTACQRVALREWSLAPTAVALAPMVSSAVRSAHLLV